MLSILLRLASCPRQCLPIMLRGLAVLSFYCWVGDAIHPSHPLSSQKVPAHSLRNDPSVAWPWWPCEAWARQWERKRQEERGKRWEKGTKAVKGQDGHEKRKSQEWWNAGQGWRRGRLGSAGGDNGGEGCRRGGIEKGPRETTETLN